MPEELRRKQENHERGDHPEHRRGGDRHRPRRKRQESLKPGSFKYVWRSVSRNKGAVVGMIMLAAIVVLCFLSPYICKYPYAKLNMMDSYQTPNLNHLFGTDEMGRDLFSRVLYGARYTLIIGLLATAMSAVLGIIRGAAAGYFGGIVETCLMRFLDIFQACPTLVLAMAFFAVFGTGVDKCILALGITGIPGFARLMRANILRIVNMEYIEAARTINCPTWKIILKHIIPNSVSPVIVEIAMTVSRNGLTSSSLSFLGLGVQPPKPEWGAMLSAARSYIRDYPHMVIIPGIFIVITVLSFNLIGDAFRGATWVSIHNGGGVGWGEVINGGFGMVIDGSDDAERRIRQMLLWDVNNGIARRSWARNAGARAAIRREMERTPGLTVTLPNIADDAIIDALNF